MSVTYDNLLLVAIFKMTFTSKNDFCWYHAHTASASSYRIDT